MAYVSREVPAREIAKILAERDGSEGGVRRITLYYSREGDVVAYGVGFNEPGVTGHFVDGRWEYEHNGSDRRRGEGRLMRAENRAHRFVSYVKQSDGKWVFHLHETLHWPKR
jgi:hypothetical protein